MVDGGHAASAGNDMWMFYWWKFTVERPKELPSHMARTWGKFSRPLILLPRSHMPQDILALRMLFILIAIFSFPLSATYKAGLMKLTTLCKILCFSQYSFEGSNSPLLSLTLSILNMWPLILNIIRYILMSLDKHLQPNWVSLWQLLKAVGPACITFLRKLCLVNKKQCLIYKDL